MNGCLNLLRGFQRRSPDWMNVQAGRKFWRAPGSRGIDLLVPADETALADPPRDMAPDVKSEVRSSVFDNSLFTLFHGPSHVGPERSPKRSEEVREALRLVAVLTTASNGSARAESVLVTSARKDRFQHRNRGVVSREAASTRPRGGPRYANSDRAPSATPATCSSVRT